MLRDAVIRSGSHSGGAGVHSGAESDWCRCVDWLVRCGLVAKDHRVLGAGATVQDLALALKDGVLLCNLLNRLKPRAVSTRDFSQRPQGSQVCRVFFFFQ